MRDDLPVMTVRELSSYLRISVNSAYSLVRSGNIGSVRAGKRILIPRKAVCEFLEGPGGYAVEPRNKES
jgi:excisionase family DNA binding protein